MLQLHLHLWWLLKLLLCVCVWGKKREKFCDVFLGLKKSPSPITAIKTKTSPICLHFWLYFVFGPHFKSFIIQTFFWGHASLQVFYYTNFFLGTRFIFLYHNISKVCLNVISLSKKIMLIRPKFDLRWLEIKHQLNCLTQCV